MLDDVAYELQYL